MLLWQMVSRETLCSNPLKGQPWGIMGLLKTAITDGGLRAKLGALLLKDSLRGLKKQLNYSDVGGAVLFGVKAPVVKTHGSSDDQGCL